MRLEEGYINYVRDAIDFTVGKTGYPCLGMQLEIAGIADRRKLRILVKRGHLKTVIIRHVNKGTGKGTQYKAYYTERAIPEWVTTQKEGTTA